ncbi:MAG: sigma 54-interacting transcriptional regulator [Desulfatitalea sp.]|nr:sigma 54-interacting transcriptional regulator [Desulfatitalea sp.]MBI5897088.1 sigma 54-interacting transcriptional regulator [Desulfobacterales bacterium]
MSGKSPKAGKTPAALNRAIDFYRLLNEVPLGVLILDRRRRVLFCNHTLEAIVGITAAAAQGLACRHVMRSRACLTECPAASGKLSENVCFETDLINRDRKRIPVRGTLAPIFDADGNSIGFVETVEDLRPLKEYGEKVSQAYSFGHVVGQSRQMEKLFRILPVIAQSDASVLITGETGTGKDMLAETLHQESDRAKGPFVKINCGALPETLLESELFGHVKGAFTGATENKQGRFYLAHNGTLYLTEIGDLPLPLQVKLLTFLDDKIVYPLGATKGFAADVRVVAATHRNLERMVREGRFRQDLFFRLNVLRLHIPPLREREGDVRLLLDHFLNYFTRKTHRAVTGYAPKAMGLLLDYDYPGNVRELRNIIEYAVNVGREGKILPKHLPAYLSEERESINPPSAPLEVTAPSPADGAGESVSAPSDGTWPMAERRIILEALVKAKGNRQRAAQQLGWARSTLWRKMKHYGMDL